MKRLLLFGALLTTVILSCEKNKFETRPRLKVKSIDNTLIPVNGSVRFTLEFTDKEGDVSDSLFIKKVRLNQRVVATNLDSFWTTIPNFPLSQKGEFLVDLDYQTILSALNPPFIPGSNPPERERDTLVLKFLARDNEGNKSDTVTSGQVIVIRQ